MEPLNYLNFYLASTHRFINCKRWVIMVILSCTIISFIFSQSWLPVGNTGFSPGTASYTYLGVNDNNVPYVAFMDEANGNKLSVMKYTSNTWSLVGPAGITPNSIIQLVDMDFDNNGHPWVIYPDNANVCHVIRFNGSSWIEVDQAGLAGAANFEPSIEFYNGEAYVAYTDNTVGGKITVKKFNGTNWVLVGAQGMSAGFSFQPKLKFHNGTPYVAYTDWASGQNGRVSVKKFSGGSWSQVGTQGFTNPSAVFLRFAIGNDGTPYVAFADQTNGEKGNVMKYNGSSWVFVGSPNFTLAQSFWIDLEVNNGELYFAHQDVAGASYARLLKFNGTSWAQVGGNASTGSAYTESLEFINNVPYMTFRDVANGGKASVYKYDLPYVMATINTQPSNQTICEGENVTFEVSASGSNISYQWIKSCGSQNFTQQAYDIFELNGTIYIAHINGISILAPGSTTWTHYSSNSGPGNYPSSNGSDYAADVFVSPNGTIYIATGNGIGILPVGATSWTVHSTTQGASGYPGYLGFARDVDVATDGTIYAAMFATVGVLTPGATSWSSIYTDADINEIQLVGNNLYVATNTSGVRVIDLTTLTQTVYSTTQGPTGLPENFISGIDVKNGTIYAQTQSYGLAVLNPGASSWTIYNSSTSNPSGFPSNCCTRNVAVGPDGTLYVSADFGLLVLSSGASSWQLYSNSNGYNSYSASEVHISNAGVPYIAANSHVIVFGGETPVGTNSSTLSFVPTTADEQCSFKVVVTDNQNFSVTSNPVNVTINENVVMMTCPPNITVNTDPTSCFATNVALGQAAASDNCNRTINITNNGLSSFPQGTNTVTWNADDNFGNTSSCTQLVTVSTPQNQLIHAYSDSDGDGYGDPSTDQLLCEVSVGMVTNNLDCNDGDQSINPTSIENECDNIDNNCDGIIAIDEISPTLVCPVSTTIYLGNTSCTENFVYISPSATDNCGNTGLTISQTTGLLPGDAFPVGTTTNTFVATDNAGNESSCSFTVTVLDTLPPFMICNDLTISLDENGTASITIEDIDNGSYDNCEIQSMYLNNINFNCSNSGMNSITMTYTDIHNNSSSCTVSVFVTGSNFDNDLLLDVCDPDDDNDGVLDVADCNPFHASIYQGALDICDDLDNDCDALIDEGTQTYYVAERSGKLTKVDINGVKSTVASIANANGVALQDATTAYVSRFDGTGTNILKVNLITGTTSNVASLGGKCHGIGFDNQGNLLACNEPLGIVHKIDLTTNTSTNLATGLNRPTEVLYESASTILISEYNLGTIVRYNYIDNSKTNFATGLSQPTDMYREANGDILVAEGGGALSRINGITGARTVITTFTSHPHGIAKFDNNHVLLTRYYGGNIVKVNTTTGVSSVFSASLINPVFISFSSADQDGDGSIDFCDEDVDNDGDNNDLDCSDANPNISFIAAEACDGIDNDCDNSIDEMCPPVAKCFTNKTVNINASDLVYNGSGLADVYTVNPSVLNNGSFYTGSPQFEITRVSFPVASTTSSSSTFNWTTLGACQDATPGGGITNEDKGYTWESCLPVAPADFNKIRNYKLKISDQYGISECSGTYKIVLQSGTNSEFIYGNGVDLSEWTDNPQLNIYPNPGNGDVNLSLNLDISTLENYQIIVFDILGKEVKKISKIETNIFTINTDDLPNGAYTFVLSSADSVKVTKWIKY